MPPLLSIIIPTLNEEREIVSTLSSLQPLRKEGVEVILSDGGSVDETLSLASPLVDCIVRAPKGRARQMNAGAALAKGRYILFLHADTQLPDKLQQLVAQWYEKNIDWGFFRIKLSGSHFFLRLVARGINIRSSITTLGTGDQCLFFKRQFFWEVGGFSDIPLMEDVEINYRCRSRISPYIVNQEVVTSSRLWKKNGIVKTVLKMWWLRLQYMIGVSPQVLVKKYYPHFFSDSPSYSPQYPYETCSFAQFAKAPRLGEVKTRMQPYLTKEQSFDLHLYLVEQCFNQLALAKLAPQTLWLTSDAESSFPGLSIEEQRLFVQQGRDLGERMSNAVATLLGFDQCAGVVLVGSDCPFMNKAYLSEAMAAMCLDVDVVVGPASDGGYVLLGLRRNIPELFCDMDWGTDRVLQQTLDKCQQLNLAVYQLPALPDIDRPEDLALLPS